MEVSAFGVGQQNEIALVDSTKGVGWQGAKHATYSLMLHMPRSYEYKDRACLDNSSRLLLDSLARGHNFISSFQLHPGIRGRHWPSRYML